MTEDFSFLGKLSLWRWESKSQCILLFYWILLKFNIIINSRLLKINKNILCDLKIIIKEIFVKKIVLFYLLYYLRDNYYNFFCTNQYKYDVLTLTVNIWGCNITACPLDCSNLIKIVSLFRVQILLDVLWTKINHISFTMCCLSKIISKLWGWAELQWLVMQ